MKKPILILPILFILFIILILLLVGPLSGDIRIHLFRLKDVANMLRQGNYNFYISDAAAGGRGLPIYIFYSSWQYLVPALLYLLGIEVFLAMKMSFILLFCLSLLAMYLTLREVTERLYSVLGALMYASSLYFLYDIFNRAAFAELYGFILLPFIFLYLLKWLKSRDLRCIVICALFSSLFMVLHPLSFMNSSFGIAIFIIVSVLIGKDKYKQNLSALISGFTAYGFLLLTLGCFFWLPVMIEKQYVLLHKGLPTVYSDTFVPIKEYFNFFNAKSVGFFLIVAVVIILFQAAINRRENKQTSGLSVLALAVPILAYFLLTLYYSKPIWSHFAILQRNIFVTRMLLPLTFFSVLLVSTRAREVFTVKLDRPSMLIVLVEALIIIQPVYLLSGLMLNKDYLNKRHFIYQNIRSHEMNRNDWGMREFLPDLAVIKTIPENLVIGSLRLIPEYNGYRFKRFHIPDLSRGSGFYRIDKIYNRWYKIFVDGRFSDTYSDKYGNIVLYFPGNSSKLEINKVIPVYVYSSWAVSLFSFLCSIWILWNYLRRKSNEGCGSYRV